jgi:hypothetical protein
VAACREIENHSTVIFAIVAALSFPLRSRYAPSFIQLAGHLGQSDAARLHLSLALFIVPPGALAWWFARRPDLQFPRKHFGERSRTGATGFLLDLLFGNAFSSLSKQSCHAGCEVPAIGGAIPIESSFSI